MNERKYRFKKWLSAISLTAAIFFGLAGVLLPPRGEIDSSVLLLVAQFLTASGTFLGLDVYFLRFINHQNRQTK